MWIVNTPSVVSEIIDGELVVMNLATGNYFSSVGVGARIWSGVEKALTREALIAAVVSGFAVEERVAAVGVDRFVAELLTQSLVREAADHELSSSVTSLPAAASRAAYGEPELKVYSDMQDLLMLDPIHDVAEEGWPTRPPELKQAG